MDMDMHKVRREKIRSEIASSVHLERRGIDPLDMLDDMVHAIIELQKNYLKKRHPGASEQEILDLVR